MMDVVSLELPRGPERDYLLQFGVVAVYVACAAAGSPCIIGTSRDLLATAGYWKDHSPVPIEVTVAYWTDSQVSADLVVERLQLLFKERLTPEGRYRVTAEQVRIAIERVSLDAGVRATCHDVAMQRVKAGVERMTTMLAEANKSGHMRWFNRMFKAYRQAAARTGGRTMSYSEALARLRKVMVHRVAAGQSVALTKEVFVQAFPAEFQSVITSTD
ncbi:hypothetical protein PQJ75_00825 [Rhodoplanes sp. TEM]|uniref:Uncharacterized protein n=1 Tax=Rhodoplanes tepidamans TaxID=200616 RepID=A0ABT5J596_RHOTP|nr:MULTISPECIES: hypothetical protein [Rhodoplanes]MDC7784796.1 hypothetical protein [Rhodoplanes tepidamans]MDC7982263.1 hypothetical protein [Rhodoplanes sp. TEM]MDQ0356270.1 hypothetical protein [Rhodoplanes tepidamans]